MTQQDELKPCPFCGEAELKMCGPYSTQPWNEYFVQCQICTCTGPSGGDEESATYQWNEGKKRV